MEEYIDKIVKDGSPEEMEELKEILIDLMKKLKESDYKCYKKYKTKMYEMAYGKVLTEEMAENIVKDMKPDGEHWNIETTTSVKKQYGLNMISDVDFFIVMNMAYNDYKEIFGDDVDMYVKYSKAFIMDNDAKEDKVYIYFTKIPKDE